ncbi:class I adenylate-forming enzyme family protein [Patulibacter sp.]|uniref:class I adenylate-forming enzyme family protein n=1 Tax=Patulibacter sp. TaxID=1912859 RepID=UPI00271D87CA|nr:AMP-binding protein [Patulibacter sp.]MDO9409023.1 AMP-binding protein [Patulibacter sp.]
MTSVPELVQRAARWYGDAPAVTDEGRTASFRDVDARSNRLANALLALSPQRGARVALLMRNRLEFVEADFAVAKAAKVRVPINPRLVSREREWALRDSGAETLVFDAEMAEFVAEVRGRLPSLRHLIAVGPAVEDAHDYDELLDRSDPRAPGLAHAPDDDNFILYTSGTTGRPKGATSTNRGRVAATVNMLAEELDARPGDAMAHLGAMSHGSGSKVLAYFLRGARNVTVRRFEPDRFLHQVEHERITSTFVVPTMIHMLVEAAADANADTRALKRITYGGAPIAPARIEEAMARFGPVFVQVYGSCEAPHPVTVLTPDCHVVSPEQRLRLASVGREVPTVELELRGPDGLPVPDGEPGELTIRGDNVMRGYWNNATATDEVLRDGWYSTGDVARRDDDGFYSIVDRARDMIVSGGLNVYPAEVEAAIHEHPEVVEVAVAGIPDEKWGEAVKAFVVRRAGSTLDEADVLSHCRLALAGYKKPQQVAFVEALPRGSTGKILKRELVSSDWEGRDRRVS